MKADIEEYQYKCHESYTHRFPQFFNGFRSTDVRRQTNYGPYSCKFLSGGRVLELDKKKAQRWSRSLTGVALFYGGSLQLQLKCESLEIRPHEFVQFVLTSHEYLFTLQKAS